MTKRRTNLAGVTTSELLEKLQEGKPFFVATDAPNITRMLLNSLKLKYGLKASTRQQIGGLWIEPEVSDVE